MGERIDRALNLLERFVRAVEIMAEREHPKVDEKPGSVRPLLTSEGSAAVQRTLRRKGNAR